MLFGVSEGLLKLDCRGKSDKKKHLDGVYQ